jgi:MbtH protein
MDHHREGHIMEEEDEDSNVYDVVVNHEEQYSIWRADRDIPRGWRKVRKQGSKTECLAFINEVWTDMRPLSLREKMKLSTDRADSA